MRKILVILGLCVGLGTNALQAQLADKLVPHMGVMWEHIRLQENDSSVVQNAFSFYNFHIGTYYTLAHYNDIVSVGVDGSLQLGLNFTQVSFQRSIFSYVVQVPLFLTTKVGATATPYNQQAVGVSAGIGGTFNHFNQPYFTGAGFLKAKSTFFVPSAIIEGTILSRGNPITARLHLSLTRTPTDIQFSSINGSGATGTQNFKLGNIGIGLIYGI